MLCFGVRADVGEVRAKMQILRAPVPWTSTAWPARRVGAGTLRRSSANLLESETAEFRPMSMYTRCPHCETHFRVSREQLQVSSGQVRCGRCQSAFDAFATLTSHPPAVPGRAKHGGTPSTTAAVAAPLESRPAANALIRPSPTAPGEPGDSHSADAGWASQLAQSRAEEREPLTLPDDLFSPAAATQAHGGSWAWFLGSFALVLALSAQTLYIFPTELVGRFPQLRPLLTEACVWLHCDLALPRMPDQLFIEASDLQVLDTTRPAEVLLTATIRNRAAVTQELPLIELTLLDRLNQTSARKVFHPADYLDKSQDPARGIGSNLELPVKLYLDTGDIRPAGYRLYIFYA